LGHASHYSINSGKLGGIEPRRFPSYPSLHRQGLSVGRDKRIPMKVGKADFSDYLIGAIAHQAGCSTTYSFDRKLIGEKGFTYPIAAENNLATQ